MAFTKEQEAEGRRIARERLSNGPLYYTGQWAGASRKEHTEKTLWPYCVPADQPLNGVIEFHHLADGTISRHPLVNGRISRQKET
jgi:hypothetical protein